MIVKAILTAAQSNALRKLNNLSQCYLCLLLHELMGRGKLICFFMFVLLILHSIPLYLSFS